MQLWTDYEGVTIDGAFPLKKLLMPEGRSAFFSTAGTKGEPTVVRLIECHFDEEEILARWRSVEALNHPNFLKFERFGQTELDGRPVVYAVFENVDGNLAEVLDQGHLSVKDVEQLASSLAAALEVLHTHGFVHEHIEPRNIFAVGDLVKLRGDCIREAPEGEEGRAAKQRDVRDLATVLLQGLTQRESIDGVPESSMPPPFGQIIRSGLDGRWGLEDIKAALEKQYGSKKPAAWNSANAASAGKAVPEQKAASSAAKPSISAIHSEPKLPITVLSEEPKAGTGYADIRKDTWGHKDNSEEDQGFSLSSRWMGIGIVALLLLLCIWVIAHTWSVHRHKETQTAAISRAAGSQPVGQSGRQISTSGERGTAAADAPGESQSTLAGSQAGWRVIAFTYNRRADAQKKASDLARSHPELKPAVFTPTGKAPYMVSIGGIMDRDAARALAHRSRRLGLPRDAYAQNYSR